MKEEKWQLLREFTEKTQVCLATIILYVNKHKFPEDIAYYDFGIEEYGQKRYFIKVNKAIEFIRQNPSRFRRVIKKINKI